VGQQQVGKVVFVLGAVLVVIALLAVTVAWSVLADAASEEQKKLELSNHD
jgi:Tfp pilus assembly protein PilX